MRKKLMKNAVLKPVFHFNRAYRSVARRSVFHCFVNSQTSNDMNTIEYATFRTTIRIKWKKGVIIVNKKLQ